MDIDCYPWTYLNKCKVQHGAGKPMCIVRQTNKFNVMFVFSAVVSSPCSPPGNELLEIALEIAEIST